MNESDLRIRVLIPLFERLGFKEILHNHGPTEKGKDFVMWKKDELGVRVNHAVVVKSTRITGKAAPNKGSAGEVTVQAQQCLSSTFSDKVTGEQESVEVCWVVTSHEISIQARELISASLKKFVGIVRLIDGDALWNLVKETFPECEALDHHRKAAEIFASISEQYRIDARIVNNRSHIDISPSNPNDSIPVDLSLKFPSQEAESTAALEYRNHIEKGTPFTLDGKYIDSVKTPTPVGEFIGSKIDRIELIKSTSNQREIPIAIRLSHQTEYLFAGIQLKLLRYGTKEISLSNSHQDFPLTISVTIAAQQKRSTGTLTFDFSKGNAHQQFKALELWHATQVSNLCQLIDVTSGFSVLSFNFPTPIEAPPAINSRFYRTLEAADYLQRSTKTVISLPTEPISDNDFSKLIYLKTLLTDNRVSAKGLSTSYKVSRNCIEQIRAIDNPSSNSPFCMVHPNHIEDLFGHSINIGTIATIIDRPKLSDMTHVSIQRALDNADVENIEVSISAHENSASEIIAVSNLSPSEIDELPQGVKTALKNANWTIHSEV